MRNESLLQTLARMRIFTVEDAMKHTRLSKSSLLVLLSRLEHRGRVERIEKGKYIFIPLESRKGEYTLNEFVIASSLVKPSAIAYWSALNYHGLTEQIPTTVFVQTTSRKKRQELEIFGVRYRIVRVKENKFFGLEKVWLENRPVFVTDREKTIVDCLDKPEYCGGIVEVAKALKQGKFDAEKLVKCAVKMKNSGVIRRLGYLSDLLGLNLELPEVRTRNYLYLDPTMPHKGEKNSRWKLVVNVNLEGLE
ncbi:type IV toxin-antitoxin system AbiEi family antitoxin domain-containing protein [Geoglobus ahangari]